MERMTIPVGGISRLRPTTTEASAGRTFNVCIGGAVTMAESAAMVDARFPWCGGCVQQPTIPWKFMHSKAGFACTLQALGFDPRGRLEDFLDDFFAVDPLL